MAKATKNFYWKGKLVKVGDEAPKGCPRSLTDGKPQKDHQKVSKTIGTKKKKTKVENKNAAPKTEDKGK